MTMKQCIDSKQLKELNPNQFRKLCMLIEAKYYCNDSDEQIRKSFQNEHLTMYISVLEKTNIGKMIEILLGGGCSCIDCTCRVLDDTVKNKFYGKEFCDSLWEATKIMLSEYY